LALYPQILCQRRALDGAEAIEVTYLIEYNVECYLPLTNDGGQPRIGNGVERVTIVGDIVSPAPRFRQDADVFRCGGSGIWKNPGVPFVPASRPTVDAMCGLTPAPWLE